MMQELLQLWFRSWRSIIEIILLSVGIYYGYLYFRGTRGAKVLTGLAIVFLTLTLISTLLNLVVIGWLVRSFSVFLAIALVVIFQPELRRGLAELGGHPIFSLTSEKRETVHDLAEAVTQLANKRYFDSRLRRNWRDARFRFLGRARLKHFSSEGRVARRRSDYSQRPDCGGGLHFSSKPTRNLGPQSGLTPSRRAWNHGRIGRGRDRGFGRDGCDFHLPSPSN